MRILTTKFFCSFMIFALHVSSATACKPRKPNSQSKSVSANLIDGLPSRGSQEFVQISAETLPHHNVGPISCPDLIRLAGGSLKPFALKANGQAAKGQLIQGLNKIVYGQAASERERSFDRDAAENYATTVDAFLIKSEVLNPNEGFSEADAAIVKYFHPNPYWIAFKVQKRDLYVRESVNDRHDAQVFKGRRTTCVPMHSVAAVDGYEEADRAWTIAEAQLQAESDEAYFQRISFIASAIPVVGSATCIDSYRNSEIGVWQAGLCVGSDAFILSPIAKVIGAASTSTKAIQISEIVAKGALTASAAAQFAQAGVLSGDGAMDLYRGQIASGAFKFGLAFLSISKSGFNHGFKHHPVELKQRARWISFKDWREKLQNYGGGGTTGLRQEQKRFLSHQDAETFETYVKNLFKGSTDELKMRDLPPAGRVLGTVTDYPVKGKDGWVVRIREYTSRAVSGGSHEVSDKLTAKLEIKIPVPEIDGKTVTGVVRKPSITFYKEDLKDLFDSVDRLRARESEIIKSTMSLNKGGFDEETIRAVVKKVEDLHLENGGRLDRVNLSIQYERQAYALNFKDQVTGEVIPVQMTKDKAVSYRQAKSISDDNPYFGPYASYSSGAEAGAVPDATTIIELKVPVNYVTMGIEEMERRNPNLAELFKSYVNLKNVEGVELNKGKSAFFRNNVDAIRDAAGD